MKEHPIIFSTESVRAILDGVKTQTRRVIKYIPQCHGRSLASSCSSSGVEFRDEKLHCADCGEAICYSVSGQDTIRHIKSPFGVPGDRLWVREAYCPDWCDHLIYKADNTKGSAKNAGYSREPMWHSPLFMPKKLSRLTLEITEVRCERLIDIKAQDVLAEGYTTKLELINAWNFLNAKRGFPWESNPWVWVLTFKKLEEAIK